MLKESKDYPTLCWDTSINWGYWRLVELGGSPHSWVEGRICCYVNKRFDKKIKQRKYCLFIGFKEEVK